MEKHNAEQLNALVGENVTVKLTDGQFFSGILTKERRRSKGFVGFMIILPNGIKVCLSKDSIEIIKKVL